jgi:hypothetical protein
VKFVHKVPAISYKRSLIRSLLLREVFQLGILLGYESWYTMVWALCSGLGEGTTSSVAHESRTPYYGLGFFELLLDLGRAGFTSLTRVKARVDTIVFESMKITI